MKYEWEEMSMLGRWHTVRSDEPPIVKNGRIKRPEGQGPRVRNLKALEPQEERTE